MWCPCYTSYGTQLRDSAMVDTVRHNIELFTPATLWRNDIADAVIAFQKLL
jgi:hypothetical protein